MRFFQDMTQIAERVGVSQMQVSRLLTLAGLRRHLTTGPDPNGYAGVTSADTVAT